MSKLVTWAGWVQGLSRSRTVAGYFFLVGLACYFPLLTGTSLAEKIFFSFLGLCYLAGGSAVANRSGLLLHTALPPVLKAQIIEPTLRDLQDEHTEALATNRPWLARWVLLRGYYSLAAALVEQAASSTYTALLKTIRK